MAYFGKYNFNVDTANRIIIPSRFREQLGAEAVFYRAEEGCLYLYDTPSFEAILAPFRYLGGTQDGRKQMRLKVYDQTSPASVDRNGRLVIPAECMEHAGIKDEVMIVGADNRIEVWNKDTYTAHAADADKIDMPPIVF